MMHLRRVTVFGLGIGLVVGCGSAPQQETTPETTQEAPVEVQVEKDSDAEESREDREDRRREGLQEAIAACSNAEESAECSFETPRGQQTGICVKSHRDEQLVCRPSRPEGGRGPREGHASEEMSQACEGKTEGAECAFGEAEAEIKGKCFKAGDDRLVCRPERKEGMGTRGKRAKPSQMNEAKLQACAELSEGAECSFEGSKGTVTGTCKKGRKNEQLICMPAKGKGKGEKAKGKKGVKSETN
jgi:hypothetical protein